MKFSDFRQPDGWYKDAKGCDYEDAEDFLQIGLFKFCGCGRAQDNLRYIMGGLALIDELKQKVWTKEITYEAWQEHIDSHFGKTVGADYFFWYWAAEQDLTEHGGAVPGWLSQKGYDVLAMIREWHESVDEDGDPLETDSTDSGEVKS